MGFGDDIMATAWARVVKEKTGREVTFGYWSEVFENNRDIVTSDEPAIRLPHRPGQRPYILGQYDKHFIFNPNHRPVPGHIHFSTEEKLIADRTAWGKFVLVEPHVKGTVSGPNKDWGWRKWVEFAEDFDSLPLCQLDYGKPILPHVRPLKCESFRLGMALLSKASLFIGTDGGLHHAAAALNIPAVVIWGHYVSPEILGYYQHANIWHGTGPCGSLFECDRCKAAMAKIGVDEVIEEVEGKLNAGIPEKKDVAGDQAESRRALSVGA